MKKLVKYLLIVLCVICCNMIFASCSIERITSISLNTSSINASIGEFNYDDYTLNVYYSSGRDEQIKLNENMISPTDKVKLYQEGEHTITVLYQNRTFDVNVTVSRNTFTNYVFDDVVATYTGESVFLTVNNVPEGTEITYPNGNSRKNAGEYEITAILKKDGYEITSLKANLTINKADYDLSHIVFQDKTEVYDGTAKNLSVEGDLPVGLNAIYTITGSNGRTNPGYSATNSGRYVVTVKFSGDEENYNTLDDMSAILQIEKAQMDMSKVTMEDLTVDYDMLAHSITIDETKLPWGVFVEYENNEHIDAGVYIAKAKFSIPDNINYYDIPDITSTLTINKVDYDMSDIYFDSDKVTYDGMEHSLRVKGTLPGMLEVTYSNNQKTEAGRHTVTAHFVNNDANYNDPEDIEADLIIEQLSVNMSEVELKDTYVFDKLDLVNYIPTNLPDFVEFDKMVYYKVDHKLDDLTEFDGKTGDILLSMIYVSISDPDFSEKYIDYSDELTENFTDGYYVAVAVYKDNPNLKDVGVTKAQIKLKQGTDEHTIQVYLDTNYDDGTGNIISVFRNFDNPGYVYVKTKENGEIEYIRNAAEIIFRDREELTVDIQRIKEMDLTMDIVELLNILLDFYNNDDLNGLKRISAVGYYYVATRFVESEGFFVDDYFTYFVVLDYAP